MNSLQPTIIIRFIFDVFMVFPYSIMTCIFPGKIELNCFIDSFGFDLENNKI